MSIQENCRVVSCKSLTQTICELVFEAPGICALAQPGQFVHIACGEGNLLRRPISICEVKGDTMRIVFQIKGDGTKWLSTRREGDVLDVLGSLGHGYSYDNLGDYPVFIGGGIGVPPMLNAMQEAKKQGKNPTAILGFRDASAVILEEDFRAVGETLICTDNGTYGTHGFVSDLLREQLAANKVTAVCACGPKPMLRALAMLAEEAEIPCQVSLEERMGCGIGACLVCACALKGEHDDEVKYGHVCKNGPVFDAKEVVW